MQASEAAQKKKAPVSEIMSLIENAVKDGETFISLAPHLPRGFERVAKALNYMVQLDEAYNLDNLEKCEVSMHVSLMYYAISTIHRPDDHSFFLVEF